MTDEYPHHNDDRLLAVARRAETMLTEIGCAEDRAEVLDLQQRGTRRTRLRLVRDEGYGGTAACELVSDGADLFIVFNGERIAKRGQPNMPQAETWVSLVPGYIVTDDPGLGGLTVTSNVYE